MQENGRQTPNGGNGWLFKGLRLPLIHLTTLSAVIEPRKSFAKCNGFTSRLMTFRMTKLITKINKRWQPLASLTELIFASTLMMAMVWRLSLMQQVYRRFFPRSTESVTKDSMEAGKLAGVLCALDKNLLQFQAKGFWLSTLTVTPKPVSSLFNLFDDGTRISWRFTTDVSGDQFLSGSGYITALNFGAGAEEDVTYSYTIEVDGTTYQGNES